MQVDWTLRTIKDRSRIVVAKQSAPRKNHLLAMPSDCGLDVQHLIEKGVSHQQSVWTIVDEHSAKIESFKRLRILEGYKARYHTSKVAKLPKLDPIDFAWFDLCGNLTKDDMLWLGNDLRFMSNADIWFTFSLGGTRGNSFIHRLSCLIPKQFPKLIQGLTALYHPEFEANQKEKYFLPMMIRCQLLQFLFPTAGYLNCYFYNDTQPMGLFHLKEFGCNREATELDAFIGAFLDETHLVGQLLNTHSIRKARENQQLINKFAAYHPDSEKFKARIRKLVEKEQKKLAELTFG